MELPNVEVSELRYFHSVAVAGSFAEGARRTHVSGPTVSKAIKKLEESLGATLFDRSARQVGLTAAGEVLLEHATAVLESLRRLETAVHGADGAVRGEFIVGCSEEFSVHALPVALVRLARKHPKLVVRTFAMGPDEVIRKLSDGDLDLGLVTRPLSVAEPLRVVPLVHSPTSVVCGATHPLSDATEITADDLAQHPFVVQQFFGEPAASDDYPTGAPARRVGATVEQLPVAIQMVIEGGFLGVFPDVMIRCQLNHAELRKLGGLPAGRGVALSAVHRVGAAKSVAIEAAIAELGRSLNETLQRECAV